MSQITETICDQCGARKMKSNNWFKLVSNKEEFRLFRPGLESGQDMKDICSENCASKALSEFTKPKKITTSMFPPEVIEQQGNN